LAKNAVFKAKIHIFFLFNVVKPCGSGVNESFLPQEFLRKMQFCHIEVFFLLPNRLNIL